MSIIAPTGRRSGWTAILAFAAVASTAHAAQPLVTDDAALVPPKACQLEAWARPTKDATDYVAQPGCNVNGHVEIGVGLGRARPDDGESSSLILLQAKVAPWQFADGEWSFGAVIGAQRDTGAPRGSSAFQAYYALGLASWYPRDDLEIDVNLGAANVHGTGTYLLAGIAMQYTFVERVQLLAETFRDEPGRGKFQVGLRWIVVPDVFEAYASYGNRFHGSSDERFGIIGIRLQSPAFLP